jgi:hypothetical protein
MAMRPVELELASFALAGGEASIVEHLGRRSIRFQEGSWNALLNGVELEDGVIEVDLAVSAERSFHGVVWRAVGRDFESFFARPHQVGNDDAIQYTPNPNGISSWQLYHGPGFWRPIRFPIDAWFTLRVAFAGGRAQVFLRPGSAPILEIPELKLGPRRGGVGVQVGGPGLHVARVAYSDEPPVLVGTAPAPEPPHPGLITQWDVSDAFPEAALRGGPSLDPGLVATRSWTELMVEPSGLANLGRVNPLEGDRNTVLARATIDSPAAVVRPLEIGFSDRATLFLNGHALFRGDETYRNRDYRFLGSIGWWDTVFLPLEAGRNEIVIAVSEDFGGWGVQARFADASVAEFSRRRA